MNHLDVTTRSIYGNIRCHYERGADDEMNYTFAIPANSQANIVLPCLNHQSVFENGKDVKSGENGVVSVEYKDGKAYLKIGSGNYTLQIKKKEATGIQEVNISRARLNDVYYDLEGRNHGKVRPSQKGIFIWNRKKVVL